MKDIKPEEIIEHARNSNNEILIKLIKEKPEIITWEDESFNTLYSVSVAVDNKEIIELIKKYTNELLIEKVKNDEVDEYIIEKLLENKPDIEFLNKAKELSEKKGKNSISKKIEKNINSIELIEKIEREENEKDIIKLIELEETSVKYETEDKKTAYQVALKKNKTKLLDHIIKKLFMEIRREFQSANSKRMIKGMLKKMTELNSKPIHFIFELIQNAEDNDYDKNILDDKNNGAFVTFKLSSSKIMVAGEEYNNYLLFINNEKGFKDNNIKSICSATESTKKKSEGYIGEKGIGFKSVFKVTDNPYIFSNRFNFYFKKNDPSAPAKFVYPYIYEDKIPEIIETKYTNILLPMNSENYLTILGQIKDIKMQTLLFLDKLKRIELVIENESTVINKICYIKDTDNDGKVLTIKYSGKEDKYWHKNLKVLKPEGLLQENRE